MIRIVIALFIGGGILAYFGYNEHKLASSADSNPQTITAADLAANGYGDNAHVKMTDFFLLDTQSVVEYPEDNENRYNKIWAPVIELDNPYVDEYMDSNPNQAPPAYRGKVGVILYSTDINNDNAFLSVMESGSVQGMIINDIDQISGEELSLLKQGLPGINEKTVLVLEHNRKPKSTGITMLMMAGGVLLMLVGPGMLFLGRNK
jgi:hypothetical protein